MARAAGLLGAAFLAVAVAVTVAGLLPGDESALIALHDHIGNAQDEAMVLVGDLTLSVVIAAVAVVIASILWVTRGRRAGLVFFGCVAVALALNPLLKEVVGRPRPDVRTIPTTVSTHSFPSGHAADTAALVGALILVAPSRTWRVVTSIVGAALCLVVGYSRLAIGAHYPSDIVGGWLWVGAWVALLGDRLRRSG